MRLRPAVEADFAAILALTAESVHFLSPLDPSRRVVLAAQASRHLVVEDAGSLLYEALFERAARESAWPVTAEFDLNPPNPDSERFHARFGFREVGRPRVAGGLKQVSLQVASGSANDLER